jgi:hypothetical protein
MTTSMLNTHVRDSLCEHDIQVLRDYALEAPWEWRVLFEELADIAEANDKVEKERDAALTLAEESKETCKDLKAAVKNATEKMLKHVVKLEAGRLEGNLTKGDIDKITEGVREAFEDLRDHAE